MRVHDVVAMKETVIMEVTEKVSPQVHCLLVFVCSWMDGELMFELFFVVLLWLLWWGWLQKTQ